MAGVRGGNEHEQYLSALKDLVGARFVVARPKSRTLRADITQAWELCRRITRTKSSRISTLPIYGGSVQVVIRKSIPKQQRVSLDLGTRWATVYPFQSRNPTNLSA